MFDLSQRPISGGFVLSCVLYAGASLGAGQLVGARTIAKLGWTAFCETSIEGAFEAERAKRTRADALVPETDCESLIGRWHPDLNRLCWEFNNPDLGGPGARAARDAERLERELAERQLAQTAAGAGSQCACAAPVYRRQNMIALAVYARSARAIRLPQVTNVETGLEAALSEPLCANFTGGVR